MTAILTLISSSEKTDHALCHAVHVKSTDKGGKKVIESGLTLTGNDADLLRRALSEVKTKVYEESNASLDDTQALDALLSSFRNVEIE
jgi:hypothetical protein